MWDGPVPNSYQFFKTALNRLRMNTFLVPFWSGENSMGNDNNFHAVAYDIR